MPPAARTKSQKPRRPAPAAPPAVQVEGLSKRFGAFTAVDGLSFAVPQGGIFAFLGPNGAGKSTTIKMLTTLLRPSAGRVLLQGRDVAREPQAARRSFGIVFQDPSLDDELSALENLELHGVLYGVPAAALGPRMEEMLRFVDLWDRRDDLVKRYSGGMKRRLEIARALLHSPAILFLDEPTVGLDPQTRNHLWDYVQRLSRDRGVTVFLTTHYIEEAAKVATEVAVIDHGKLVAQGTPAQLMRQTRAKNLEAAFIQLTGRGIRDEEAGGADRMRQARRLFGR
jgi:ABC-2 type transport system ATP-binding protein